MQRRPATLRTTQWVDIMLPLVLTLTGLILIGGDRLGMLSLDRIQNLWPLAVIVIGVTELLPGPGRMTSEDR